MWSLGSNPRTARTLPPTVAGGARGVRLWHRAVALVLLVATGTTSLPRMAGAQARPQEARLNRALARGDAQLAGHQPRAAARTFARALAIDPTSVRGLTGLLRAVLPPIEAQSAEATAAEVRGAEVILGALDRFPERQRREELQLVEATVLVALRRQREALAHLSRPPRIPTPALLPVLEALALLSAERGDLSCAESALYLALELDPNPDRAMRLSDVHLARGDAPRAVPLLMAALRFDPQSIALHLSLARAQLAAGDARGADVTLGRVFDRCPRQCGLLRARVALESDQLVRATEVARSLLTLTPDPSEAAAAGFPDAPDHRIEAGFLLGLALARDGRPDDAQAALEEALERDPTHRGARQALRAVVPAGPPR